MKFVAILLLSLMSFAFFSCQKELQSTIDNPGDSTIIPPKFSNKLKTYTEDQTLGGLHLVVTFNISYDAGDRIVSLVSASSSGDKLLFQYNSNNTITLDIFGSNLLNLHEIFFINSSSLLDSTFQYNDTNDSTTEKYIYNAAKQLIQLKQYNYSLSTGGILDETDNYTYDNNGNQMSDVNSSSVTTYDYTDIVNNITIYPFSPLFSAKPVRLIKTTTITSGGNSSVINHTYTFDSHNRLSTEKQEVAGGNEVVIKTYTYVD